MKVLVTDGDSRAALALTRGLGRVGHAVFVSAPERGSISGRSRFCAGEYLQAPPSAMPTDQGKALRNLIVRLDPDFVIGVTDRALTVLHGLSDTSISSRMPPPDAVKYFTASDKVRLLDLCRIAGIPTPRGVVVPGGSVPTSADVDWLGRRLVVRPAYSWRIAENRWVRGSVGYEESVEGLARRVKTEPALAWDYIVQERIAGDGCGLFVLAHEGRIVVQFSHLRLREKPPEGGVSTLCESVAVPADLVEYTRRFVDALGWSGLAMLEFKRNRETGRALLLEVNARPWGSLALASAVGLDFPNDLLRLAAGIEIASKTYRQGVRLRWWWGDVDHFYLLEKSRGRSGAKALAFAVWAAATAGSAHASDTFSGDDPLPFVAETIHWALR